MKKSSQTSDTATYGVIDKVTGKLAGTVGSRKECDDYINFEKAKYIIRKNYDYIIKILKNYLDLKEHYYQIITIWILGSYLHNNFESYPYLFFNAMRGSGKTRALKIIVQARLVHSVEM